MGCGVQVRCIFNLEPLLPPVSYRLCCGHESPLESPQNLVPHFDDISKKGFSSAPSIHRLLAPNLEGRPIVVNRRLRSNSPDNPLSLHPWHLPFRLPEFSYSSAIASISTRLSLGRRAASTVVRAGG